MVKGYRPNCTSIVFTYPPGDACCSIKTAGKEVLNQRLCCMHPNIIQLHEVFLTPEHLAIVSELAPGGDLVDYIERHSVNHDCALKEAEARWLFQQLIVAVDYCHQVKCALCSADIRLTLSICKHFCMSTVKGHVPIAVLLTEFICNVTYCDS